eukprot:3591969-Prymnesium_polylepis.1
MCCLVEPQLIPQMLNVAETTAGKSEHVTNFVTSLGQTAMNLGTCGGPFAAVPIIQMSGFRGALAAWAAPYALVSAWAMLRSWVCRLDTSTASAPSSTHPAPSLPTTVHAPKGPSEGCTPAVEGMEMSSTSLAAHPKTMASGSAERYQSLEEEGL